MGPAECLVTVIDRSVPSSVLEQASACGMRPLPHAEVHDLRVGCKVMWFTFVFGARPRCIVSPTAASFRAPRAVSSRLAAGHRRRRRAAALTARARCYTWPRGDDAGPCRVVAFTADHQFPGDACNLVGERHGGELRRLARHQIAQPR